MLKKRLIAAARALHTTHLWASALALASLSGLAQANWIPTLFIQEQEYSSGPITLGEGFFVTQGGPAVIETLINYNPQGGPEEPFAFSFLYIGNSLQITALQTNTYTFLAPRFYYGVYPGHETPVMYNEFLNNVPPYCGTAEYPDACSNELADITTSLLPRIEGQTVVIALPAIVPEPSTWLLMLAGLGTVAWQRRRA